MMQVTGGYETERRAWANNAMYSLPIICLRIPLAQNRKLWASVKREHKWCGGKYKPEQNRKAAAPELHTRTLREQEEVMGTGLRYTP